MSAQVIQCKTVQNHQAEALIRKSNTSTECTSLKVLIKDTTCLSLNSVQYTNLSYTRHLSASTKVYTDPNKYNMSNMKVNTNRCHQSALLSLVRPLPMHTDLCPVPDSTLWYNCEWTKE